MTRIDIDDEVYEALAAKAVGFQQPNDVLRGVLGLQEPTAAATPPTAHSLGRLAPLVEIGLLNAGDSLVHTQPRLGRRFVAHVDADGAIVTDRGRYLEPSPALRDLVGSQIDGWARWIHEPTGKTLRQLRHEAGGRPRGA